MPRLIWLALMLGIVGVGSTAASADGVRRPRNYATSNSCDGGAFAGPYIGAAIGFAQHHADIKDQFINATYSGSDTAFSFGGYAGYNLQCSGVVLGIETDINTLNSSATATVDTNTLNSQADWYGTLRARAGFVVHDSILLYATGGLAYAKFDHTFADSNVAGLFGPFSRSDNDTTTGWTFGGGLEFTHDERWLFRAETFFVDLGSSSHTYVAGACPGCTASAKWEDDFWVGRLGLSYKFNRPEPVVPLK